MPAIRNKRSVFRLHHGDEGFENRRDQHRPERVRLERRDRSGCRRLLLRRQHVGVEGRDAVDVDAGTKRLARPSFERA